MDLDCITVGHDAAGVVDDQLVLAEGTERQGFDVHIAVSDDRLGVFWSGDGSRNEPTVAIAPAGGGPFERHRLVEGPSVWVGEVRLADRGAVDDFAAGFTSNHGTEPDTRDGLLHPPAYLARGIGSGGPGHR